MVIAQATVKGQILIPADLRRKYHIRKGSRLAIIDKGGEIVLKPLTEDPISYGHGLFKKGPSALKGLIAERKVERISGSAAKS